MIIVTTAIIRRKIEVVAATACRLFNRRSMLQYIISIVFPRSLSIASIVGIPELPGFSPMLSNPSVSTCTTYCFHSTFSPTESTSSIFVAIAPSILLIVNMLVAIAFLSIRPFVRPRNCVASSLGVKIIRYTDSFFPTLLFNNVMNRSCPRLTLLILRRCCGWSSEDLLFMSMSLTVAHGYPILGP